MSLAEKTAAALAFGGAAVYRCGNCLVLNSALAAEGTALDQELLFPQVVKRYPDTNLKLPNYKTARLQITNCL
jgi:hypothetical protein